MVEVTALPAKVKVGVFAQHNVVTRFKVEFNGFSLTQSKKQPAASGGCRWSEAMSFRRRRDEWDEFLKRHGAELRACGLPDYVVADKMRFLVFLDHGYDDWGRAGNNHAFFDAKFLTDDQIARLADVVGRYVDAR